MSRLESQRGGVLVIVLILVVVLGLAAGVYFVGVSTNWFNQFGSQQPSVTLPSPLPSPRPTPDTAAYSSTEYENPFEQASGYQNPFEESYENPFSEL